MLVAVIGCGGKFQTDPHPLGNEAGAGTGGVAAGGAGAGGGIGVCASFVDEKPLSVRVLIRNKLNVPIHLGRRVELCSETPLFLVQDAAGKAVSDLGNCRTPCESLLDGNPIGGCIARCPYPEAVTLASGESVSLNWPGLFDVESDLPNECVPKRADGQDFGTRCSHSQQVPSGSFSFSAEAGTLLDCSYTFKNGCPECTPNAEGGCRTNFALISGARLTARTTVKLDAASQNSVVELTFAE